MKTAVISALFAAALVTPVFASDSTTAFFEEWDLNSDGEVSQLEAHTHLTAIFSSFDTNLDGYIDDADEVSVDDEDLDEDAEESDVVIDFDDDDGDGRVSLVEFIALSADWLTLMDADADGVITTADFALLET